MGEPATARPTMPQKADVLIDRMHDVGAAYQDIHGKHVMHMMTDTMTGVTVVVLQPTAVTTTAGLLAARSLLVQEIGVLLDATVAP